MIVVSYFVHDSSLCYTHLFLDNAVIKTSDTGSIVIKEYHVLRVDKGYSNEACPRPYDRYAVTGIGPFKLPKKLPDSLDVDVFLRVVDDRTYMVLEKVKHSLKGYYYQDKRNKFMR
ncbi:MAG: hypothetical protein JW763_07130 [candidate division Zixibacteria bacterium]|nr:hypothetical protein [candidate division Zixibacteria bacterium]